MSRESEHCFLCDAMLGKLCRWLRLLGFDCLYAGVEMKDREIADLAEREMRFLLTKDRELASKGPRTLLVESVPLESQLAEVFSRLGLTPDLSLMGSRCSQCNGVLLSVEKDAIENMVPPHVFAVHDHFRRCRGCGRIYWSGSHLKRIRDRLERALLPSDDGPR